MDTDRDTDTDSDTKANRDTGMDMVMAMEIDNFNGQLLKHKIIDSVKLYKIIKFKKAFFR
jgi:hypothetical protein